MEVTKNIDSSCISWLGRERGDLISSFMDVVFLFGGGVQENNYLLISTVTTESDLINFCMISLRIEEKNIMKTAISKKIWQKSPADHHSIDMAILYQTLGQRWGFCRFTQLNVDPETCESPAGHLDHHPFLTQPRYNRTQGGHFNRISQQLVLHFDPEHEKNPWAFFFHEWQQKTGWCFPNGGVFQMLSGWWFQPTHLKHHMLVKLDHETPRIGNPPPRNKASLRA